MPLGEVDLLLIIGGCVVVAAAGAIVVCCFLRSRRRKAADLESATLINDDRHEQYSTTTSGEWKYGELDYAGLKRVLLWLAEVRHAFARGIEPIQEEPIVDSALLGQQDDIGSPPQGYSPRVSAIGSDDGYRRSKDTFVSRDPLRR